MTRPVKGPTARVSEMAVEAGDISWVNFKLFKEVDAKNPGKSLEQPLLLTTSTLPLVIITVAITISFQHGQQSLKQRKTFFFSFLKVLQSSNLRGYPAVKKMERDALIFLFFLIISTGVLRQYSVKMEELMKLKGSRFLVLFKDVSYRFVPRRYFS